MPILYGIEEGFYYSVFNSFESDGVDNKNRAKYYGNLKVYNSILSVIFPIFFGSIIAKTGFIKSLFIVIIIVILRVLMAFLLEDKNISKENKTILKACLKIIKEEEIEWYVNNEEKIFKCCGFVPLGKASLFIDKIEGDYNTLLGISPSIIYNKLKELGYSVTDLDFEKRK